MSGFFPSTRVESPAIGTRPFPGSSRGVAIESSIFVVGEVLSIALYVTIPACDSTSTAVRIFVVEIQARSFFLFPIICQLEKEVSYFGATFFYFKAFFVLL